MLYNLIAILLFVQKTMPKFLIISSFKSEIPNLHELENKFQRSPKGYVYFFTNAHRALSKKEKENDDFVHTFRQQKLKFLSLHSSSLLTVHLFICCEPIATLTKCREK